MTIYITRKDGQIKVKKKTKRNPLQRRHVYYTIKTVKDTPKNFGDILRWANALGYDTEEL